MRHVDAGTIAFLRDERAHDAPEHAHLRMCAECVAALDDARARATLIADALAGLDAPIDLAAAKAATRARLDRARARGSRSGWRRWPLGRAAVLLLATAGAVSALTWTPVRNLWSPREPSAGTTAAPTPAITPGPAQVAETSGIAIEVGSGEIAVIVRGAAPGALLDIVWGSGGTASVSGPAGSGFSYGGGRLEVEAAPGNLRLELPRSASSSVEVGGRVYLTRSAVGVTVTEPTLERTDDLIRFVVPGP